jgi:hypothetical protein
MSAEQSGTAIVIDVVFRQWADLIGVANDARRDWIVALSPECVEAAYGLCGLMLGLAYRLGPPIKPHVGRAALNWVPFGGLICRRFPGADFGGLPLLR